MLDMSFIREHADVVKEGARKKGVTVDIDALLALNETRAALITDADEKRALRNRASKQIAEKKKAGEDASDAIAEMRQVSQDITDFEQKIRGVEADIRDLMLSIPNVPADDVPEGRDDGDNVEIRAWGDPREFVFTPKPHWDLGAELDILDFERAAKITGSHWPLFKGAGAAMVRALINFMIDEHTKNGYVEVFPPFLANRESTTVTGQLPKFEEDMYRCDADDLFLIPTAEVPVTNIHRDETLDPDQLPICYTAYTACFRREAGSYGRDTRALMRVHQFDKVEMVKFCAADTSWDELETLLQSAEGILRKLELPYRVLLLCTGEMTFASAKTYDLEVWAPGIERWMEVSSCSNFLDFQARRGNIRTRDADGKMQFLHTLNGSGLALPRVILSILESYQQENGTVVIPEVLRPYMGGREIIS